MTEREPAYVQEPIPGLEEFTGKTAEQLAQEEEKKRAQELAKLAFFSEIYGDTEGYPI